MENVVREKVIVKKKREIKENVKGREGKEIRSTEWGCDYALLHAALRSCCTCTFAAHALQPPPETSESDPAPCRYYGGASVRKSRRMLLANDSLVVVARLGLFAFRSHFASSRFVFSIETRTAAAAATSIRTGGFVDLVAVELVESRSIVHHRQFDVGSISTSEFVHISMLRYENCFIRGKFYEIG